MLLGKRHLQWFLIVTFPFLVGALCSNSSFAFNQSIWTQKNISNYTMTVTALYLPAPASDVQVVVRNSTVIDEKLLECEAGQSVYQPATCEALKTYYYRPGGDRTYTIDRLFQTAESCIEWTKKSVARYGLFYQFAFTGFRSADAMFDFEKAYRTSLTSSDFLCSVEYDSIYGYPKQIVTSIPNVLDGGTAISVNDFHVDQ